MILGGENGPLLPLQACPWGVQSLLLSGEGPRGQLQPVPARSWCTNESSLLPQCYNANSLGFIYQNM